MLVLNGVTICCQNLGTILAIFLQGKQEDIERRYYAFWNYGATNGELEYWCDSCGLLWLYSDKHLTAVDKLYKAFVHGALMEILNKGHTKGRDPLSEAWDLAEYRISQIEMVNWYCADYSVELYGMGESITAEKGTGNFDDEVLGATVEGAASHKGIEKIEGEEEVLD